MNNNNNQHQYSQQPFNTGSDSNDQRPICKKFLKGNCYKHPSQCSHRHELDIVFCHDYQNHGCVRENCTFLHTTKEEEKIYKTSGVLPQVLAERYTAMAATANMSNPETVQQIAIYIKESYAGHGGQMPPPPPPVSLEPPPPPPPEQVPVQQLALAPPPTTAPSNSHYPPVQIPNGVSNFANLPPPVRFNVPPPPIYPPVPQNRTKRTADNVEAGPSKIRKPDDSAESHCGDCVQKEQSIGMFKNELDILLIAEEQQSLLYKKKVEEFERLMSIMKSHLDREALHFLETYVEQDGSQRTLPQDVATHSGPLASDSLMAHILSYSDILRGSANVLMQPIAAPVHPPSAVRFDDSLLQRRFLQNDVRNVMEAMGLVAQPDRSTNESNRSVGAATATTSGTNGIRLSVVAGPRVAETPPQNLNAGFAVAGPSGLNSRYSGSMYPATLPGSSGVNSRYPAQTNSYQAMGTATQASGVARPAHINYNPAIPPPNPARPYYAPYPNNSPRAGFMAPAASRTAAPPQDNHGRYTQYPPIPPYNSQYPPYQ